MDKKYFTYFNREEAKPYIGKKCRFSDYSSTIASGKGRTGILRTVRDGDFPFMCGDSRLESYEYCTPVETIVSPYENFEEMAKDAIRHGLDDNNNFKMRSTSWERSCLFNVALVPEGVLDIKEKEFISFEELVEENCMWYDGTPCGVKEEV